MQVYLDTPDTFMMTSNDILSSDGYVNIEVKSSSGDPVENAVIAILNNGEIVSKGISSKTVFTQII